MGKFDFNDVAPDLIEPDFSEPIFSAPSIEDLENEFSNEPKKTPEESSQNEPSPSLVNLSGMDGTEEKSSPEIDYGEETPVDADDVFNRKFPSIPSKEPVWVQKTADKMSRSTKEMIIQGTAFSILLVIGAIAAMFFSYNDKKTTSPADSQVVAVTESQPATDEPSVIKTKKWEPGIVSENSVTTEHNAAATESTTTEQPTTRKAKPITTETDTEAPAVPSDERFKAVADLTLYIQNSTSVIYRKEKETVQSYADGQTDLNTFLSTMNTYSVALKELSHLLIVNHNCYKKDEITYQILEKNISDGMIYADNSVELANAGTPPSEFKDKLGE